ncbi:MAG: cytochrome c, partial [Myxococcota bacterium]|nr:cytochrome c [Myxococcota bacterium]
MEMMMGALALFALALVLLFLLRKKLGVFWGVAAFFGATIAWLRLGIDPPVPASVMMLYVGTMAIALLLYATSSEASRKAFLDPIVAVMCEKRLFIPRLILVILIPAAVGYVTHMLVLPSEAAPPKVRSVHPSPPNTMKVLAKGMTDPKTFDIIKDDSPLRPLEETDPAAWAEKLATGRVVYYQNCYFCHGDVMAADGHLGPTVKPPPASFQDPGTIAMLEEAFLYWRVAKGGPGLPDAGTPWDSSMPVWENMLTEDEMWAVIAYM